MSRGVFRVSGFRFQVSGFVLLSLSVAPLSRDQARRCVRNRPWLTPMNLPLSEEVVATHKPASRPDLRRELGRYACRIG